MLIYVSVNYAQTIESDYELPLPVIIKDIESLYGIKIKCNDSSLILDKSLKYARWRYECDVEKTLFNVLYPLNLSFKKIDKNKYQIIPFQYFRLTPDRGKERLDCVSSKYNSLEEWEIRKRQLKACIIETLGLPSRDTMQLPRVVFGFIHKKKGYITTNFYMETLPGLYVCGTIYKPQNFKEKIPLILCPNGHFPEGRYNPDVQYRCAMIAKMGAIAVSWDLFAWGESQLQFPSAMHRTSIAMQIQYWNALRILDYFYAQDYVDRDKIGITGASTGGSYTMVLTAIDERIKLSVPVAMLSSYHYGGCPCESGLPIHFCGNGTNNPEIAAICAPRPMLIISDGKDWTAHVPEIEFPYLKKIYSFYNASDKVENVHFPDGKHDYGYEKRVAMYNFIVKYFNLENKKFIDQKGEYDESKIEIDDKETLMSFGKDGRFLPSNAIVNFDTLKFVMKKHGFKIYNQ